MIKLKQLFLIVISMAMLVLSACSHQEEEQIGKEDQATMTENSQFNTSNPEVQFEKVGFKDIDEYTMNRERQ